MGLFDKDEKSGSDEVMINPEDNGSQRRNESKLKTEVEDKVVDGSSSTNSGDKVSSVASGSQVSNNGNSKNVDVEDVYRQNERIIELLEKLTNEDRKNEKKKEKDDENFDGDLNGVL